LAQRADRVNILKLVDGQLRKTGVITDFLLEFLE
jgi:hypothetical protein